MATGSIRENTCNGDKDATTGDGNKAAAEGDNRGNRSQMRRNRPRVTARHRHKATEEEAAG